MKVLQIARAKPWWPGRPCVQWAQEKVVADEVARDSQADPRSRSKAEDAGLVLNQMGTLESFPKLLKTCIPVQL